jgi:hypothetical protein
MLITCILAYITATFLVEAVSVANTVQNSYERKQSVFSEECYKTPQMQRRVTDADGEVKESKYYIRQKVEIGVVIDRVGPYWGKYVLISILIVYVYGATALKYASGAICLYQGISFLIWGNENQILEYIPNAYYLGIAVFGTLCIIFSFGDIENSKNLQIFSVIMRFVCITMMFGGTLYYLGADGINHSPVWDWQV